MNRPELEKLVNTLPDAALVEVIQQGDRERLATALATDPALITTVDDQGMTLLHWAIAFAQPKVAADLLGYPDVPLDAPQTSHGRTALHMAAIKGQVALIKLLLDAGANVFVTDTRGLTPLDVAGTPKAITALRAPTLYPAEHLRRAIQHGALTRIDRLLRACPFLLTTADAHGRTPLQWAVGTGNLRVIDTLIAAGVPVNTRDVTGETPLHDAARRGELKLVSVLLAAGANPRLTDYQQITPLHIAAGHGDATRTLALPPPPETPPEPSAGDQAPVGQCAFAFDALPTAPATPTTARKDRDIAAALIAAGADIDARAHGRLTALHLAASLGDAALVKLLLAGNAQVDVALSVWQATPSHLAAAAGHHALVKLLRRAGANPASLDCYGRSVTALLG